MTKTTSVIPLVNTLALFKAWGQDIENALLDFGWVRAADTGQVDWSTVALPSVNSAGPILLMKSTDALSSTMPIIIRFEFRRASSSQPVIYFQVGTATNGTGSLVGPAMLFDTTAPSSYSGVGSTAAGLKVCHYSGDAGRFSMVQFGDHTDQVIMAIERSRDAAGAITDEYVSVVAINCVTNAAHGQQVLTKGGALSTRYVGKLITALPTGVNAAFMNTAHVSPFFPPAGRLDRPGLSLVAMKKGDFSNFGAFTVEAYGTTHGYLAYINNGGFATINAGGDCAIGMLWE